MLQCNELFTHFFILLNPSVWSIHVLKSEWNIQQAKMKSFDSKSKIRARQIILHSQHPYVSVFQIGFNGIFLLHYVMSQFVYSEQKQ